MSQYTETKAGFQRAMEMCLTGSPKDTKSFIETYATPTFYRVRNGHRSDYDVYLKDLEEWRAKVSDYKPVIDQFLRDGDRLACRMEGKLKVDGVETVFESSIFATVDKASGRFESLTERAVWGPQGGAPEHGAS